MEEEMWNMYLHFPHLVPHQGFIKWEGYVNTDYPNPCQVVVKTPKFPSLEGLELFCSQEAVEKKLKRETFESLSSLLTHLQSLLEMPPSQDAALLVAAAAASEFGEVSEDLKTVTLHYTDSAESEHEFVLSIPTANKPITIIRADLPEEMLLRFTKKTTVAETFECFKELIESLVPFWTMLHRLSLQAWVVEPFQPTRKDVHRRLYISDNLSVHLVFSPLHFNEMPEIKFLGSVAAANLARTAYQDNLQKKGWDPDIEVAENLSCLLNLDCLPLPPSQGSEKSDSVSDCIICYEGPGISPLLKWCPNSSCSSITHHSCLIEWLNTIPTSKICFDHITGPCPHCDEKLFCPLTV